MKKLLITVLLAAVSAGAQDAISLKDAVLTAIGQNKSLEASAAARNGAQTRIAQARSGLLPKVNYSEPWTRSNNPVFVFGSLLSQRQFGAQNFEIGSLNSPNFINNFQSQITVDQTLYGAGQTKLAVRSAELTKGLTTEERRRTQTEAIAQVIRAYYDSLLSADQLSVTAQSIRSAEADLERAQNVRNAGMSTDVDVLSIRVHLASVRELQIRRQADVEVARAALNDAIGLPLDASHTLTSQLVPLDLPEIPLKEQESTAIEQRPEARQAKLAISLAETQVATARSSLLPQVTLHGAFEAIVSASSPGPETTGRYRSDCAGTFLTASATSPHRGKQICRGPRGAGARGAKQNGAQIERFNLAQQPMAFAQNSAVKAFLERSGEEALPVVLVNGEVALAGRYPNRAELARWAGILVMATETKPADTCCSGSQCC